MNSRLAGVTGPILIVQNHLNCTSFISCFSNCVSFHTLESWSRSLEQYRQHTPQTMHRYECSNLKFSHSTSFKLKSCNLQITRIVLVTHRVVGCLGGRRKLCARTTTETRLKKLALCESRRTTPAE